MRMLRRQVVNFAGQGVPAWYGWGALLLAVLLAADAALTYSRLASATAAVAAARASAVRPRPVPAPAEQRRRQVAFEEAQKLATRLSTPWDELFNAIERAGGDGVQVQSIRPNVGVRQIVVAAEARELTAMLNFLTRLAREPGLARPYIQSQEDRADNAAFPLQFVVVADWRQGAGK